MQPDASVPQGAPAVFEQANGAVTAAAWAPPALPAQPQDPAKLAKRVRLLENVLAMGTPSPTAYEPPRSLVVDSKGEPFPLTSLPPLVRDAVEEVLGATQAPEALVACCALGVLSSVGQGLVNVARDAVLQGPVNLYVLTLAVSGERKTTVDNLLTAGLRQWEQEQREAWAPMHKTHDARVRAWQAEDTGITDRLRKAAKDAQEDVQAELTRHLEAHALKRPGPLRVPALLRGDDTPERLADVLVLWPVRAVVSSEAGIIFGSHGMSEDVAMRNLAQFNTLWDGGSLQRGRVGTGDLQVDHTRVTLSLQVQPATFTAYIAKAGDLARGIGFLGRFLVTQPESTQGGRYYRQPAEGMPGLTAFNAHMRQLLARVPECVDPGTGHVRPYVLRLDDYPLAKQHWVGYHDSVEEELGKGNHLHEVQDAAAKSADNAARLWGLFVLCEPVLDEQAAMTCMLRACAVARWFVEEALRMRTVIEMPVAIRNAMALEAFVCRRCHEQSVPCLPQREATSIGPKALRTNKQAREDAYDLLVSHGRLLVEHNRKTGKVVLWPHTDVLAEHRPL